MTGRNADKTRLREASWRCGPERFVAVLVTTLKSPCDLLADHGGVMICGGAVLIHNARADVRAETAASAALAKKITVSAIRAINVSNNNALTLADLPDLLAQPRHVRIHIVGLRSKHFSLWKQKAMFIPKPSAQDRKSPPPDWFDRLIRPDRDVIRVPLAVKGEAVGLAIIMSEPSDEIAKVWEDARSLFVLIASASAALIAAVYFALGRALEPLNRISQGLSRLEEGDYGVQLPAIAVPDLKTIGIRFNALAGALRRTIAELAATIAEKEKLAATLITVQDTERKKIALELHDEFGPCLFGIRANASSLQDRAAQGDNGADPSRHKRIATILKIVDHMQQHNRDLLHRLRPMALDRFGLPHLLEKLVSDFREREPDIGWSLTLPEDFPSCGETVDLTVFRLVQEAMTNAARHARASEVAVKLSLCSNGAQTLAVSVSDNGTGLGQALEPGMGISGMGERVGALGGAFSITSGKAGGTAVNAVIPLVGANGDETALGSTVPMPVCGV